MEKVSKRKIIIAATVVLLLIAALPVYYDTDDATDPIVKQYGHNFGERIRAASPECTDDGIGVGKVLFGTKVSYCGTSWFVLFNTFPFQTDGEDVPFNDTDVTEERATKTIASEQLGFSVAYYCLDWCDTELTIKTGEEAGGYFDYSADIPTNTENRTLNITSLTRSSADKFERLVREASERGEEVGDPVFFNYSFDDLRRVWQESEVGKNYKVAYRDGAQTDNFQAVELAGQKALYQSRGTRGYYGLMHNYYIHIDGDRWLYIYALTSEESNGDFVEEVIASISVE